MMGLNFRWNSPLFQSEWTLSVFSEWEVPSVTDWYCVCSWPLAGGVPCIPQLPFRMENFLSYCSVIRAPKLWFSSSILIQNFVSYTITSFQTFLANWFEVLLGGWLNFVQKGSLLSNQCKCCRIWFVCKLWENNTWYTYDIVKSTRVLFWLFVVEKKRLAPELTGALDWLGTQETYLPWWQPELQHWAPAATLAAGLAATKWVVSVTCPRVGRLLAVFHSHHCQMPFFCHHLWKLWLCPFPVTDSLR